MSAKRRLLRRGLPVLLAVAVAAGAGYICVLRALHAQGPLEAARDVVVPRGSYDGVADALAMQGVIARPLLFQASVWLTRREGPLHAAEFRFPAHASLSDVLEVLRSARPVQHRLTIPEGLTARQIVALIDAHEAMTGDARIADEAEVLPQTYQFERGASRETLVDRAHAALETALTREWAARDPSVPLSDTVQALTLASIVERETAKPDERPHVAAVFINRLKLGMRLQSDPTVAFMASGGGALDHPLTRAELARDDPYNTYRVSGLPPGPICAPGVASLHAALHPDPSDDLYFVADGSGGHAFAKTLAEHQKNVARWRAAAPG